MQTNLEKQVSKKTGLALLLSGLLGEPLVGFVAILPFILRKELHASGFEIALLSMVKPVVALLSFYWGASLWRRRGTLRTNWMTALFLSRLPFLFFPFVHEVWFFILAVAIFQLFQRGAMPAQMEILKQNVPQGVRETLFTWSSVLNFIFGVGIGLTLGRIMDVGIENWKTLFCWGGWSGLAAVLLQSRVPVQTALETDEKVANPLFAPWKDSWALLKKRRDFARFQIGFMLGGIGLMLVMPALILYAADDLKISNLDMTLSRFVWMGLGFVLATPFWRNKMTYETIFRKTGGVNLLFALAIVAWLGASLHPWGFFLAYFLYGAAQAGSHLSWHLSGPLFAGPSESSLFSTVNILTVGIRGVVIPAVSVLLCSAIGAAVVLWIGCLFCLAGAAYLMVEGRVIKFKALP